MPWLELTGLIRALGVKLLLMLDIGANLLFLKTHRGHCIPSCPEAFPIKVALSSTKLARNGNGTLTLDIPNHLGNGVLRRNPDQQVDMVLHHMPFHDGTPPLSRQLMQHRPKKFPNLAVLGFLPPLRDKHNMVFTISLCV